MFENSAIGIVTSASPHGKFSKSPVVVTLIFKSLPFINHAIQYFNNEEQNLNNLRKRYRPDLEGTDIFPINKRRKLWLP